MHYYFICIILAFVKNIFICYNSITVFVIVWLMSVDITSTYDLSRLELLIGHYKEFHGENYDNDAVMRSHFI
jgi:hypothetical protein